MNLYYKIRNTFIELKYELRSRWQRFKRGYADSDVWDMDHWFMRTVKLMLIHLRDCGIGVPNDLYQDVDNKEREKWEAVLTEMIECLELMDEDNAEKYLGIADDEWSVDNYNKKWALIEENKNRFFELFSKHFHSLWD